MRKGLAAIFSCLVLMFAFPILGMAYLGQYRYDNTDPYHTGCSSGASVRQSLQFPTSTYSQVGVLKLWYSPNCATAWTTFTCQSSNKYDCTNDCVNVQRTVPDGAWATTYQCVTPWESICQNCYIYSNQVYDAGTFRARACITPWADQSWGSYPCTGTYLHT
jgi:Protein of unknown function (DUF2690)